MNSTDCNCGPAAHPDFFKAIEEVFKKFPDQGKHYAIASRKLFASLSPTDGSKLDLTASIIEGKIVIEQSKGDPAARGAMGCCQYCSDDNGNIYCCISSPEC